jgi:hypothetical protein
MEQPIQLSPQTRVLIQKHLVMFAPKDNAGGHKQPSNYTDTVYLVLDMIKTSILALGEGRNHGMPGIPQPEVNVSGVLTAVLKLLPLEEFNLLDLLREAVANESSGSNEPDLDNFELSNYFLTPPHELLN